MFTEVLTRHPVEKTSTEELFKKIVITNLSEIFPQLQMPANNRPDIKVLIERSI